VIRVEVVLKNRWGSYQNDTASERALKREIVEIVTERAEADDLEIVRIQFLGPKK
jgi:hypothetical protein